MPTVDRLCRQIESIAVHRCNPNRLRLLGLPIKEQREELDNCLDHALMTLEDARRMLLRAHVANPGGISFPMICAIEIFRWFEDAVDSLEEMAAVLGHSLEKPDPLPTIWRHCEGSYSVDGKAPKRVSAEHDDILTAFMEARAAMQTSEIEEASGRKNVPRAIKSLKSNYEGIFAGAVQTPRGGKKGTGGYFIHVRPLRKRTSQSRTDPA